MKSPDATIEKRPEFPQVDEGDFSRPILAYETSHSEIERDDPTMRLILKHIAWLPPRHIVQRAYKVCAVALLSFATALCLLAAWNAFFSSSYARPPAHYDALRNNVSNSNAAGRANPNNERVFLVSSLRDPEGELVLGVWGNTILKLINILGPENTFLSIYISDSGPTAESALREFEKKVPCPSRLLFEDTVRLLNPETVLLPDGELAVKRIAYLVAARNIALEPVDEAGPLNKVLVLNDIYFDPVEAAQLLFLTNSHNGQAEYRAACAADFDNPWKYYDTFASRDSNGFQFGVPIYPWFSDSSNAQSRKDALQVRDAVRVKACWGGMVAFDAKFFRKDDSDADGMSTKQQVRFRSESELDWEYSECCLIHADVAAWGRNPKDLTSPHSGSDQDTEIYMNPFVRTAYSDRVFHWLFLGRRTEGLLHLFQDWITWYVNLPFYNKRRDVAIGQPIRKTAWVASNSSDANGVWTSKTVNSQPGAFCGVHHLLIRRMHHLEEEDPWETILMPHEPESSKDFNTI